MKLVRYCGLGAMLGGVLWAVDNRLAVIFGPGAVLSIVPLIVAEVLIGAGLLGLHVLQRGREGRIGTSGLYLAVSGVLGQVVGLLVFLAGSNALNWLAFPAGYLVMLAGLVVYGVATVRARILPRWCGAILILVPPLTMVVGDLRGILFGLLWVVLGFALWTRREAGEPPRIS